MCKSMINVVNTNTVTGIASGNTLPLGSISRKFGCNLGLIGNEILVNGKGYYDVFANVTIIPSATDIITVQLYQDGVAVPGAKASATIATGVTATMGFTKAIRLPDLDIDSRLSLVVTAATAGTTVTQNNLSMEVVKL